MSMLSYLTPWSWTWDIIPPIWMIHGLHKASLRCLNLTHLWNPMEITALRCMGVGMFTSHANLSFLEEVIAQNKNHYHYLWQSFCKGNYILSLLSQTEVTLTLRQWIKSILLFSVVFMVNRRTYKCDLSIKNLKFNSANQQLNIYL